MQTWVEVDDSSVRGSLQRLIALGKNPAPVLAAIGELGVASTQLRFKSGVGPDGQKWKPSLRAQILGGITLTKDRYLSGSLSSSVFRDGVAWGVGLKYGRIHQFGGVIRAKSAGALKFRIPGGGFAVVKAVRMPARPYLGVNDTDRSDILDILARRIWH